MLELSLQVYIQSYSSKGEEVGEEDPVQYLSGIPK